MVLCGSAYTYLAYQNATPIVTHIQIFSEITTNLLSILISVHVYSAQYFFSTCVTISSLFLKTTSYTLYSTVSPPQFSQPTSSHRSPSPHRSPPLHSLHQSRFHLASTVLYHHLNLARTSRIFILFLHLLDISPIRSTPPHLTILSPLYITLLYLLHV